MRWSAWACISKWDANEDDFYWWRIDRGRREWDQRSSVRNLRPCMRWRIRVPLDLYSTSDYMLVHSKSLRSPRKVPRRQRAINSPTDTGYAKRDMTPKDIVIEGWRMV